MPFDREYFESQYRDYRGQNPGRKLDFYRELAEKAAAGKERPRILDVGCAFALFLTHLGPRWQRFGCDASSYAIEIARKRDPDLRLAVSEAPDIPFEGEFDVVTAFDVLEHLADLDAALGRIHRKLRAGGSLVFVVPVYDGPTGPLIRLLDRDPTHLHRRSRAFWLERASRSFEIRDWLGIFRYLLPGPVYAHIPTRALRRMTPAIACIARRKEER